MLMTKREIDIVDVISHLARDKDWDQYCFKTERALKLLTRIEVIDVSRQYPNIEQD